MIKFENVEVVGWEAAIRGMRNPKNSWEKSDSAHCRDVDYPDCIGCSLRSDYTLCKGIGSNPFVIGPNDLSLMKRLRNAGTDHRKFMRMIAVYVDITAPLYWWKEFDTYKVGTVANSCSTMHKIADKEFVLEDFSTEHLINNWVGNSIESFTSNEEKDGFETMWSPVNVLELTIKALNSNREAYLKFKDKKFWWQMIQLLPSSYNQRRTVVMNYEVLANIYKSRKNHKLDEWSIGFMEFIKSLPYFELITGEGV